MTHKKDCIRYCSSSLTAYQIASISAFTKIGVLALKVKTEREMFKADEQKLNFAKVNFHRDVKPPKSDTRTIHERRADERHAMAKKKRTR